MDVAEMNRTDGSGRIEEFLDAAYRADNRTISDNLACGLSVDVVDDDNTAALQIAAAQGDLSVYRPRESQSSICSLRSYGFQLANETSAGSRCFSSQMQPVRVRGASVHKCNQCGFIPLLHAARNGEVQILRCDGYVHSIRKRNNDVVQMCELDKTTCSNPVRTLIINPAEIYCLVPKTHSQESASYCSKTGIMRKTVDVRCLICDQKVALVDRIIDSTGGRCTRHTTHVRCSVPMVQVLLQHNCDINAAQHSFTPVMIAIVCGNDALTQYLIKKSDKWLSIFSF